jgi:hypothetical protein
MARLIEPNDRLASEMALASSLEVLENADRGVLLPAGHVSAASSALLDAVDKLVTASRLAQEQDGTGDEPLPITPESLRACLPQADIDFALGTVYLSEKENHEAPKREALTPAKRFLREILVWTSLWFFIALVVHGGALIALRDPLLSWLWKVDLQPLAPLVNSLAIPISAFFWALVGSMVWILMSFRRFGAAYAFDPAQANVFRARVLSGSITTAVLMYLVFGGKTPWANDWAENLPIWAFALGYAGKLQVEILQKVVEHVRAGISRFPASGSGRRGSGTQTRVSAREVAARPPLAGLPPEPEIPNGPSDSRGPSTAPSGSKG